MHFFRGTNSTNSTNSNGLQWNIFTNLKLQSPMDSNGLKWTQDSPTVSNYLINELQKAPMGSIGPHRSSIVIVNDLLICQQWTSKDYNELIWATMGYNGLQWAPMGSNGLQWTPIGSNGLKQAPLESSGLNYLMPIANINPICDQQISKGSNKLRWAPMGSICFKLSSIVNANSQCWSNLLG